MADARSNSSDTDTDNGIAQPASLSAKTPNGPSAGDPKVTIRKTPPESRPRTLSRRDANHPDDLTRIRGIDAELAAKLQRTGIHHYDQIADWSATDVRSLSAALKLGQKIYKQVWIEQAAHLAVRNRSTERALSTHAPPADQETPAAPVPAPQRSIATLVTAAAAAIRARTRILPAEATAQPEDLPARIAAAFLKISETVEVSPARFPEDVELKAAPLSKETQTPHSAEPPDPTIAPAQPASEEPDPTTPTAAIPLEDLAASSPETIHEPAATPLTHAEVPPPDNLRLIEALPQRVADRLNELGVFYFSEIAAFDAGDVEALGLDCNLDNRIMREGWIEQAALLATGRATKASRRRSAGDRMPLAPYPASPLQKDREAFTSLSLPQQTPPPARSRAPDLPAQPPKPTALSMPDEPAPAPLSATSLHAAAAEALAPERTPAPATPTVPLPSASQVADNPTPAAAPIEAVTEQLPQSAGVPEDQPVAHLEALPFPETYDFAHEEAEVTITPRGRSAQASGPAATGDTSRQPEPQNQGDFTEPPHSNWPGADERPADEHDDHAAYLANVSEATVEIIAARPKTTTMEKTPPTRSDPANVPPKAPLSRQEATSAEQLSVSRFLKALRGR